MQPSLLLLVLLLSCAASGEGLTRREKHELLNSHNYLRSIVDPPATNMQRMEWSEELAALAQDYAEKCVFEHNSRRSGGNGGYVGENIAITNNPKVFLGDLVRGWYDENQYYDSTAGECLGNECRHYTQLVWATSIWMGCGVHRCDKTVSFPHPSSIILVCNYAPGGNIAGEDPYLAGAVPCSWCPAHKPLCQNNFCVATVAEEVEVGLVV